MPRRGKPKKPVTSADYDREIAEVEAELERLRAEKIAAEERLRVLRNDRRHVNRNEIAATLEAEGITSAYEAAILLKEMRELRDENAALRNQTQEGGYDCDPF